MPLRVQQSEAQLGALSLVSAAQVLLFHQRLDIGDLRLIEPRMPLHRVRRRRVRLLLRDRVLRGIACAQQDSDDVNSRPIEAEVLELERYRDWAPERIGEKRNRFA